MRSFEKAPPSSNIRERLGAAFKTLAKDHGYLAESDFGHCATCASQMLPEDNEKYVYFHEQEADRLDLAGFCYLNWGGDANLICSVLRDHRVGCEWEGAEDKAIMVGCIN